MFKLQHDIKTNTLNITSTPLYKKKQEEIKNTPIPIGEGVALQNGNIVLDKSSTFHSTPTTKNTNNFNIKNDSKLQNINSGLNISIQTLRSRENIPFILQPTTNGSVLFLVDEGVLSTILNEQPIKTTIDENGEIITTINQDKINKEKDPYSVLATIESLLKLEEFPAELVQFLDISELEILSQPEQAITKYNNNTELKTIIEAFINEKKSLEDEAKRNNTTCKTCTIGALNRRYLQKLLPQLPANKSRLALYRDIYNTMHCETEAKSLHYIKNETLRAINDNYFKELNDAESKPGCTQCKKNGIKVKYKAVVTETIVKNRKVLLDSYEQQQ